MAYIYILLSILMGFILMGLLFGASIILNNVIRKSISFSLIIISSVLTTLMLIYTNINLLNLKSFFDGPSWLIIIFTNLIVVKFVTFRPSKKYLSSKEIIMSGIEGMLMEIPQRAFMQSLIFVLLVYWNIKAPEVICILINSIIWCLGIIVQAYLNKPKRDKDLIIDILSSFIFSLGIGYTLIRTEFIIIPMIGHFLERIFSRSILNKSFGK